MCPRCGGFVTDDEDEHGAWIKCLMCGWTEIVRLFQSPALMYELGANHCWTGQDMTLHKLLTGLDPHHVYYEWNWRRQRPGSPSG